MGAMRSTLSMRFRRTLEAGDKQPYGRQQAGRGHSSHLWLMAEFGVLSYVCFFLKALFVAAKEWPRARTDAVGGGDNEPRS